MLTALFLAAAVIFLCIVCQRVSSRLGVPMLLIFILLGMAFGSDGVVKIWFDDYRLAEQICSTALIFIMFYGGFGTKWHEAKPVAPQAVLLSTMGVVITAGLTGLFCYGVLGLPFWESMLLGSVVGSTDAASVFSVLRSKKLNLRDHTASLLEVESGSNDPCAYMLTAVVLSVMNGTGSSGAILYTIFAQVVYGAVGGVVLAFVALWALKHLKGLPEGFDTVLVVALVLFSYVLPAWIGGNGYLSTYLFGLILGNHPQGVPGKKALVHFFDGITGLMQMLIFFLLGLLSFPSHLPQVAVPGLLIALFLTFIARPAAVALVLTPFRCSWRQQLLTAWAGLRGAASIVFAIMATTDKAVLEGDIFHLVFFIVLFSITLQGTLLPPVARGLKMIDEDSNVLRTFSDYSEETPVQFVRLMISEGHPWVGKAVKNLSLPPNVLLALVLRGNEHLIPDGSTVLLSGDAVIMSTLSPDENLHIHLFEYTVQKGDEWEGRPLSQSGGRLVVALRRGEKFIIPHGRTEPKEHDVLVLLEE